MVDTDIAYWDLFSKGDKNSFESLYHLHYETLYTYGTKLTKDPVFLEESIQDLFVKLWQNRANLNRPSSVKHYLMKSLRHTIYNKLNARNRENCIGSSEDFLDFDLSCDPLSEQILKDDQLHRVKQLLINLTPRQKEAIWLFYIEEMSYQEIAEVLSINVGAAYKLIYRALDNIKSSNFGHILIMMLIRWKRTITTITRPVPEAG